MNLKVKESRYKHYEKIEKSFSMDPLTINNAIYWLVNLNSQEELSWKNVF